jgi:hypothetical protein
MTRDAGTPRASAMAIAIAGMLQGCLGSGRLRRASVCGRKLVRDIARRMQGWRSSDGLPEGGGAGTADGEAAE